MALYEVVRVDDAQPGEFVNALVLASGAARARKAVAHLLPDGAQVLAAPLSTTVKDGSVLLTSYFDEREATPTADDSIPLF